MENKSNELYIQVMGLFLQFGIKSLTMDDVARKLGISKKTLYKHVTDKNDLVTKVMEEGCNIEVDFIEKVSKAKLNAIDENFEISKFVKEKVTHMHPSIFYDMQKYHPKAWGVMESHRSNFIATWVEKNLKKGIKEGLFRKDLNVDVAKDLYLGHVENMMTERFPSMKQYSFTEVYLELFRYHIRGIASEKGIKYLIEKVTKEKSDHS